MKNQKDISLIIKETLSSRSHTLIQDQDSSYIHAAVLIPLFRDEDGKHKILFTERTDRVEHHKGQISFPGGAVDKEDGTFEETALREAFEEIGLLREDVTILGRIDDTLTVVSNFVIHPFVGLIPHPYNFRINPEEVKGLIEVPFEVLYINRSTDKMSDIEHKGVTYQSLTYLYNGEVIWGATARIMKNFIEIIGERLDLPEKKG